MISFFLQTFILWSDKIKSIHNRIIILILNILWVIHLSLILVNTYCGIHSIPKKSKYTAVFPSINNETQRVFYYFLSSRFPPYAPCFILGRLSLKKNTIKPRFAIEILGTVYRMEEKYSCLFIYPLPAFLTPLPLIPFTTLKSTVLIFLLTVIL